uniref:Phosphatidylserine Lipase ABHD16 N-terminal domain-containing protein n=1 Tax=Melopsittacus undulatus TaxID=13146 RepID=A0A8V5GY25_MELUD
MAKLLSCVLGPRLYRVHRTGAGGGGEGTGNSVTPFPLQDSYYQPRGLEKHTDSVLALVRWGDPYGSLWTPIDPYGSPHGPLWIPLWTPMDPN